MSIGCYFRLIKTLRRILELSWVLEGIYLKTHHGKTLIDGSSGLYCNPLGHGRKEIIDAIKNQLEKLDYTMPFQQGFGGSFELATMISQKTPEDLNRIFIQSVDQLQLKLRLK